MPRFLSAEWVEAFDAALANMELSSDDDLGLTASSGRFSVRQEVRGTPGGDVALLLDVQDGRARVRFEPLDAPVEEEAGVDVTVRLGYEDARSLANGELSAAEALAGGRIKVRGDLSVLLASQVLLAAARPVTRALAESTTY